jgi:hypothetical protein
LADGTTVTVKQAYQWPEEVPLHDPAILAAEHKAAFSSHFAKLFRFTEADFKYISRNYKIQKVSAGVRLVLFAVCMLGFSGPLRLAAELLAGLPWSR